ncbi:protein mannosyltransferase 1 [Eremomyces bilateralis CBS 781.70]|uniref:Dolichyl-phosphate-mannose--protein mannosyltransferase n=1 Tax=Eremomyces bilateralis CBS 781.70 TaxID=1392243 RepID=A0A6G1G9E6_9PEZI|nr:protein mannosyltransferase 1 [Eremomyces bilateralis CBS 781.70]KAF1814530.1 protein mannosyltransferase 1 [Eremomyces bilateralis CBS 781.70]
MASKSRSTAYTNEKSRTPPSTTAVKPNGRPVKSKSSARGYASDGVKNTNILSLPGSDWRLLAVLTVLATLVRLFRIYQPSSVVFDEVHFGGFASKYIKGKFFMDVHPPLAKLLITFAGWVAGFDGDFDFKDIGKDYLEPGVPYVAMRLVSAMCGVLSIPTMFLTLKAFGCRTTTAALGAGLVIFENGLVTQSRLILLDSPLVIFTALTVLAWTNFTNQHEQGPTQAFTPSWWFWLAASGLGLGATLSVKWVGLFTIAWVGSLTLVQLWTLLGDAETTTPRLWFKHFFARFFCLIVIPLTFYMSMFAIHFVCLVNPGDGDGFMSSEFQATLNSKGMQDVPADVAYGSRVLLRHHNTQGGYLHSHNHMYPAGSKQQQITLYPHKDENNLFLLENQTQPLMVNGSNIEGPLAWDQFDPTWIEDGGVVKLYHLTTHRRLHSHDQRPPVTEADWQFEVSAYGYEGFEGDANDLFRFEIVKSMSDGEEAKKRIRTIQTKFRLVHVMTGCVLFSHKVKLPDWGFEQQEVTCARGGTLPNSIWYIESNAHPKLGENAEVVNYRNPGFFGKFWELQRVMWTTNAGLVESHAWDSRPPSWPVLRRGINFWGKDHRQIYLIGNPIIWWSSTVAVALYLAFKAIAVLRWQRSCGDYQHTAFKRFDFEIGTTVLGWGFHYFPFYLMQRQLFLHHYFPALYFAIIVFCQIFDYVTNRFKSFGLKDKPIIGQSLAVIFLAFSIVAFTLYAPLSYGNVWTQDECKRVKLFGTWDWDCNNFHTTYDQYSAVIAPSAAEAVPSSVAPAAPIGEAQQQEPPAENSKVTPQVEQPPPVVDGQVVIGREENVEYHDEHGNTLNDEQVSALQGKVSFQTRYETRTRIVDADGNEISNEGVAPPHPDVEGQNPETGDVNEEEASDAPPTVPAEGVQAQDRVADINLEARPASEGNNEATQ